MENIHNSNIEMIAEAVTEDLIALEMYSKQHDFSIKRYAEMAYMHKVQMEQFIAGGMETIILYTNKGGETNPTKNPLLATLEKLRVDMLALENVLGLNPSALAKIQKVKGTEVKEIKEKSAFELAMESMNNVTALPKRATN